MSDNVSGKSGAVASRFAGSLSSLGVPAHFVHAAEWIHGDLGEREWNSCSIALFLCVCGGVQVK